MKVIVLSWHPSDSKYYTSGGVKRFVEIAKRAPQPIIIIDRYPSIFRSLENSKVQILEYGRHFDLKFLVVLHPLIYDFIQRIVAVFQILAFFLALKHRPRIVYVPFSEHVHLTLAAVLAKLFFGCRVVLCNLNVNIFFGEKPINTFLHRFADDIITISNSLKIRLKKTGVHPNYVNGVGFEKPKFNKLSNVSKRYDAVFVGRHTKEKGFFDLLEIWNILVNKYDKEFSLITIGNIPEFFYQQIKRKIKNYKLKQYVNMLGEVSESEKIKYLAQSKILVFPSRQEGWGIAPMEALSLGLPVIAYNLDVYRESIGDTLAFRKVKLGDIDDFAKEIIKVSQNLEKLSKVARLWQPKLSWDYVAKREWELLKTD